MLILHKPTIEVHPPRTSENAIFVLSCTCQGYRRAFVLETTASATAIAATSLRMLESLIGHLMCAIDDGFGLDDVPSLVTLVSASVTRAREPAQRNTSLVQWQPVTWPRRVVLFALVTTELRVGVLGGGTIPKALDPTARRTLSRDLIGDVAAALGVGDVKGTMLPSGFHDALDAFLERITLCEIGRAHV